MGNSGRPRRREAVPSFQAAWAKQQLLQTSIPQRPAAPAAGFDHLAVGCVSGIGFLPNTADLGDRGLRLPEEGTDRDASPSQLHKLLHGPSTPPSARGYPHWPKRSSLTCQAVGCHREPGRPGALQDSGDACLLGRRRGGSVQCSGHCSLGSGASWWNPGHSEKPGLLWGLLMDWRARLPSRAQTAWAQLRACQPPTDSADSRLWAAPRWARRN